MKMRLKLGTMPLKIYETKEYKSIKVGDIIDVKIQEKWRQVKIWKLYDEIPMMYFGEYV